MELECCSDASGRACHAPLGLVRFKGKGMECSRCEEVVREQWGCDVCMSYACRDCIDMMATNMLRKRLRHGKKGKYSGDDCSAGQEGEG